MKQKARKLGLLLAIALMVTSTLFVPTGFAANQTKVLLSENFESYGVSADTDLQGATGNEWQPVHSDYASAYLSKTGGNTYAVMKNFKAEELLAYYTDNKLYEKTAADAAAALSEEVVFRFHWYSVDSVFVNKYQTYYVDYDYRFVKGTSTLGLTDRTTFFEPVNFLTFWVGAGISDPAVEALTASSDQQIYGGDVDGTPINSGWKASHISRTPLSIMQKSNYVAGAGTALDETKLKRLSFEFKGLGEELYNAITDTTQVTAYLIGIQKGVSSSMLTTLKSQAINALTSTLKHANYQVMIDNINITVAAKRGLFWTKNSPDHGNLMISSEKSISAGMITLKYPSALQIAVNDGFDFAYVDSEEPVAAEDGFQTMTVIFQYSDDQPTEPNSRVIPFGITVTDQTAPGDHEISIESAVFYDENYEEFTIEETESMPAFLPVSGITVSGQSDCIGSAQYTAYVSPEHANDKRVTWSVSDPSLATISQNGVLTAIGDGQIVVFATARDGSGVVGSKSVTLHNLKAKSITVSGNDTVSGVATYTASVSPDYTKNKTVTWSVSNSSLATISQDGVLTAFGDGKVTVYAIAKDGSGVVGSKSVTLHSLKAKSITVSGNDTVSGVATYTASVSPDYTENKAVTWSVGDPSLAAIDQTGKVTALQPGTVTVSATAQDGSGVVGSKSVTLKPWATIDTLTANVGIWDKELTITDLSRTLYVPKGTAQIKLSATFMGGNLKYNGTSLMLNKSTKTIPLTGQETMFTLNRSNMTNHTDSIYTVRVVVMEDALDSTTTLVTGSWQDKPMATTYVRLGLPIPETAPCGIRLWEDENEQDALTLPALGAIRDCFAVRVFGDAFTSGQTYHFQPYIGEFTGTEKSATIE